MDAAGKDGTIKHVMSGVNPQGVRGRVVQGARRPRSSTTTSCGAACRGCRTAAISASSTAPTTRRCWWSACTPSSSPAQKLPPELVTKRIWEERYEDINSFERYLDAQRHRDPQVLPARLEEGAEEALPRAPRPAREELEVLRRRRARARALGRRTWTPTRTMIRATATPHAPWYVVPADNKWFTRLVVAAAVVEAMGEPRTPLPEGGQEEARRAGGGAGAPAAGGRLRRNPAQSNAVTSTRRCAAALNAGLGDARKAYPD